MDSINRMEKIMALIEAHPEGLTGSDLADACGVPWGTMKQDLKVLISSIENPFPIYTDQDEEADDEESLFQPEVKWFLAAANKRFTPVHLTVREGIGVLNAIDYFNEENTLKEGLRQKILSGFGFGGEEVYRYIKGELTPVEPIEGRIFSIIENAIRENKRVRIIYNSREVMVDPLGVVYYSRLRYWYLVALQGEVIKTYHLKNIREVKAANESFTYPENFSLKDYFKPRWGMEFGELMQVKVHFLNRSQTIAKVRKDVAHRTSKLTTLDDGSILLEDEIIGVNEFITWVLGFGSAAEILEPMELRKLILKRIRESLSNYI